MEIKYDNKITINDYKTLIKSAGWKWLNDDLHQKALDNSMYIIVAKDNDKAIGIARLVGDFATHGLLSDVVVLPEYQGKGIGSTLVKNIIEEVRKNLKEEDQFLIELLPAFGKRNFYKNCGFKYKPENMDGMYLWVKKQN